MSEQIPNPDPEWSTELAGELIDQFHQFVICKTQSPEELVSNAYAEHKDQEELNAIKSSLKETDPDRVFDSLGALVIMVAGKMREVIDNSKSCLLSVSSGYRLAQFLFLHI